MMLRQLPYLVLLYFWQENIFFQLALPLLFHFGICCVYVFILGVFHRFIYSQYHVGRYNSTLAWFNRRLHTNGDLAAFYGDLTSTEVLSWILRWYGSEVGQCCQLDIGSFLEPHKVTIGDDVIFGSSTKLLTLLPDGSSGKIVIESSSNVMDRSCLTAPLVIRKRVVLGSRSVVRKAALQEGGVYSGSRKGMAVYLWTNKDSPIG